MEKSDIRRANLRHIIDQAVARGDAKNDTDFCIQHDLNQSYVSQVLNSKRTIGERSAKNIESKLSLSNGFLDQVSALPSTGQPMIVTKEDHPNDFIWIDVVDISFSCGDGISIEYHYDEIKESLPFMPEFFVKKGVKPQNTKILVASGDSMENYIYDQDLFAIDVSDTEVKDGAIYAVYFENEAMLKQIFKEQGGTLVLHSLNPKYKDRDRHVHANNGDGFRVIGRQFWRSG
jgi:phage repressor protein C with HTH and peptisase S24 domain